MTHRSAARTRRRPNAKYCAVERRRANGDDASRSAIRIAAGSPIGASTTRIRSRCVKSAVAAARARCDIPAAGLGIDAHTDTMSVGVVDSNPHGSSPSRSAPAVVNSGRFVHTAGRSWGCSWSTRSASSGSTTRRSSSRPPGVLASTKRPMSKNHARRTSRIAQTRRERLAMNCALRAEEVRPDRRKRRRSPMSL